ncbi:hypothetical protein [Clostridium botulinum]|uniref:hypothetical protein n=1 Tax=Clostridium botulinum TaxID=1491 RepID=UPI001C9B3C42|nr:hypothetical protein [Clostridium botulinum]MBY6842702.1 hypothetical protein [Clostridium botulinum]
MGEEMKNLTVYINGEPLQVSNMDIEVKNEPKIEDFNFERSFSCQIDLDSSTKTFLKNLIIKDKIKSKIKELHNILKQTKKFRIKKKLIKRINELLTRK